MEPAIALVETNSVAMGVLVGDAMVKKADVRLYEARSICPGKYMVLVGGGVGPVEESYREGRAVAQDTLVDYLFLPNAHPDIFPALMSATLPGSGEALGIIETITAATCIVAADAAAKAAEIQLLEIRLANGLGGKSFVFLEGDVSNVEAAMQAGIVPPSQEGLLVRSVIIPQLHEEMRGKIL